MRMYNHGLTHEKSVVYVMVLSSTTSGICFISTEDLRCGLAANCATLEEKPLLLIAFVIKYALDRDVCEPTDADLTLLGCDLTTVCAVLVITCLDKLVTLQV